MGQDQYNVVLIFDSGSAVCRRFLEIPAATRAFVFELLGFKHDVEDIGSAIWFLRDLAREQDADEGVVLEHSGIAESVGLRYRDAPVIVTTAIGQMGISKGRQGREAQNLVRVYLANLRLKEVGTDVLITAYEPVLIKWKITLGSTPEKIERE
ncbi:uncharacterized protein A4U43_C02F18160 [Asparagus officinalis]|uniref:Uncharacterized protein n=1 Tax=Asparagus officinalis TaxID=4686 RepID=A0A5P1FN35_ASPOF|nr:uncharacterized protein LOC109831594 isoform X2 [Asparagus officinalis]ONK78379.1 uncharacterized protein A4U43_C02F18160 [Asparagus officinalis]